MYPMSQKRRSLLDQSTHRTWAISRIATAPSRCSLITSRTSRIFGLLVGIHSSRLLFSRKDGPNDQAPHPRQGGREFLGMVAGINSESRLGSNRNGGQLHLGIRNAPLNLESWRLKFRRRCALPGVRIHDLRHSCRQPGKRLAIRRDMNEVADIPERREACLALFEGESKEVDRCVKILPASQRK
jgi:hypothetical protein